MKLNTNILAAFAGFGLAAVALATDGTVALEPASIQSMRTDGTVQTQRIVQDGIAVELMVVAANGGGAVMEGQDATLTVSLTDEKTGEALPGLTLAAWVDRPSDAVAQEPAMCHQRIESYMQADLKTRPVLDLNSYVVLALNANNSISVIDPFIGFGNTNLYASVVLSSPGGDWALNQSETRLFVTLPTGNRVAVVNTDSWRVDREIDLGVSPGDIELGPAGETVWVLDGDVGSEGDGVTVIDPNTLDVLAHIVTGVGTHRLAFSDDGDLAYVTNRDAGTVSIIDVATLTKLSDIESGPRPVGIAYASAARAAYVVDEADGSITAIDRETSTIRMRVLTNPGITAVGFDPMMGRWGFVLNTHENIAHIIDAAHDEVVHTLETPRGPDQISFTHNFAYIRSLGSADVTMVSLSSVRDGKFENMWPFPAGALDPGAYGGEGSAPSITPNPEMHDAVYVANHGAPGEYDFVFLLEDPRIIHCFNFDVAVDPDKEVEVVPLELAVAPLVAGATLKAGTQTTLAFRVLDKVSGEYQPGVSDIELLLLTPTGWQQRLPATVESDGTYTIEVRVPTAGPVYIFTASRSLGVVFDRQRPTVLTAERVPEAEGS